LARKFYRRVSRPPSGGPYEVEGTFLSGAHETGDPHDWIADVRARLALRYTGKPATKAGRIKALWPEIEAAIERGQSIKSIHKWLEEDADSGLVSRVSRRTSAGFAGAKELRHAVLKLRSEGPLPLPSNRLSHSNRRAAPSLLPIRIDHETPKRDDRLAQAMSVLSKPRLDIRTVHSDGDPDGRNLI